MCDLITGQKILTYLIHPKHMQKIVLQTPKQMSPYIVQHSVWKEEKNPIFIMSTAYKCNNSGRTPHLAHVL